MRGDKEAVRGGTTQLRRFHKGDRVVVTQTLTSIPIGSVGTVVVVHFFVSDWYDIRLDGESDVRLMHGAELESVRTDPTEE